MESSPLFDLNLEMASLQVVKITITTKFSICLRIYEFVHPYPVIQCSSHFLFLQLTTLTVLITVLITLFFVIHFSLVFFCSTVMQDK